MLGKVFKYDLKATARLFIPMYIVFFIITLVNKAFFELVALNNTINEVLSTLTASLTILYVIAIIAIFVTTFIFVIIHFYKNLMGDQGYLTFTLPVKVSTHLNSKILISIFWVICTVISALISLIILALGHMKMAHIKEFINIIISEMSAYGYSKDISTFFIILCFYAVVGFISLIIMIMAAITLGQQFGKNRIIGSVVSYIAFYMVNQVLNTILVFITGFFRINEFIYNEMEIFSMFNNMLLMTLLYSILITIVYYVLTNYLLKNKLNLE